MHNMNSQPQSPLFRLPPEIRRCILELVLLNGAETQHIETSSHRGTIRVPCWPNTKPESDGQAMEALKMKIRRGSAWRDGHLGCAQLMEKTRSGHCRPLDSPLALLLACRQLHDEVANELFASLSFVGLRSPIEFLQQPERSNSGCLDRIRTLHLHWDAIVMPKLPWTSCNDKWGEDWTDLCGRIGLLRGLRRLTVRILMCSLTSDDLADRLLGPMRKSVQQAEVQTAIVRHCDEHDNKPPDTERNYVNIRLSPLLELPIAVCTTNHYIRRSRMNPDRCGTNDFMGATPGVRPVYAIGRPSPRNPLS